MIVKDGSDRVGSWEFSSPELPGLIEREALEWSVATIPVVLAVLADARLLSPTRVIVEFGADRAPLVPEQVEAHVSSWSDVSLALDRLTSQWPAESPVLIHVLGDGVVLEPEGERTLPDVVGISCVPFGTSPSITLWTLCDAWLSHDLRAREQPEIFARNAPRLHDALLEIEGALGTEGESDEYTKFALCNRYELRNQLDARGAPLDMFELGYDQSWIAAE